MRFLKQLFYGVLFIVIFGALGWGIYAVFLKASPTCFDGIKNGKEGGVDCGGVCGKECLPQDLKEVSVRGEIKILPISVSRDRATVLLQIQNLNGDFAAKYDYSLVVKDESGDIKFTTTGNDLIYSGEIKQLVFPNLDLGEVSRDLSAEFEVKKTEWIKEENAKKPSISIQNHTTTVFEDRIEITGKFTNRDASILQKAIVIVVLYDNRGNEVGASQTTTESIVTGETKSFMVIHPFLPGINTSKTDVRVYPYK